MSKTFDTWLKGDELPLPSGPAGMQSLHIQAELQAKTGRLAEVVLREAGWLNGRYYSKEVLQEAIPLFEGVPVSAYGYRIGGVKSSKSYREFTTGLSPNICGSFERVRPGTGPSGRFALLADLNCAEPDMQRLLVAAERVTESTNSPFPISLEIDAAGDMVQGLAEGRNGMIVSRITRVFEGVLVDKAAAGGRIMRIVASAKERK